MELSAKLEANARAAPRGIGLGLRHELAAEMIERRPTEIEWVEVHPENYIDRGGRFMRTLSDATAIWPTLAHGLTLSLGQTSPFCRDYVARLRSFLDDLRAPFYSDHLCWSAIDGNSLHDLLPLPFTREAIDVAVQRIRELQDGLGIPVAVENVSYYAHPGAPEMSEIDFLLEVLEHSSAKLMLDVNNVYVNAQNHRFDASAYLARIPADRVVQIHVAGHRPAQNGRPIIDTHAEPVSEPVFELLEKVLRRTGPVPILLERDGNYPTLDVLLAELSRIREITKRVW